MTRTLFLFLLFSNTLVAQVNLNLGLVAYYPFNGNANDVSGNGHNGTLMNGTSFTTDINGNPNSAAFFNGLNNFIEIPDNGGLLNRSAMSFFMQVKPLSSNVQCLLAKENYTTASEASFQVAMNFLSYTGGYFWVQKSGNAFCGSLSSPGTTVVNTRSNFVPNTWYCLAGTYENDTIKIYLNGQLQMAQYNGTGLIDSCTNYPIRIGRWNEIGPVPFSGTIDEVRIYNRALNVQEINALSTCTLNTQTTNIINNYTPVLLLNSCNNKINVEDASAFNVGDTVLMIQMKGAIIDSSNTASFGTITDYKNSGNYEFNYVKSKTGNTIELKNILTRRYDIPNGKVQLIRVPYYQSANINSTLTCLPWDGSKGGVLVLNVRDTITLNADIDVSGKGFRGGASITNPIFYCNIDSFYTINNDGMDAAQKGEGIFYSNIFLSGRGKLANGGGGGNSTNSGGGGGGNGGPGGSGGNQYIGCGNPNFSNGGVGGLNLPYTNVLNKIFLGGGGGAGHENDIPNLAPGGNGGGIVIINCTTINSNGFAINADGQTPIHITGTNDDGRSGGGAGGTVVLSYTNLVSSTAVSVKGGNGDYCTPPALDAHGPGGGGGGGIIWVNKPFIESNLSTNINGGINGVNTNLGNNAWGALPGSNGDTIKNIMLIFDTVLFKPNIDSVKIKDSATGCRSFAFNGFAYTNTNPISSWLWNFGNGDTANSQNTSYTYNAAGTYSVNFVAIDINGCRDSIANNISAISVTALAGNDTSFCSNTPIITVLHGSSIGGTNYTWAPATFLNDSTLQSPTANVSNTSKFYLTVSNGAVCTAIDSVTITINPLPLINTNNDTTFCAGSQDQLNTVGASTYSWSPSTGLNNSNIANPIAYPTTTTQYMVTGTDLNGCSSKDSVVITVNPLPVIVRSNDTIICKNTSVQLFASGGTSYIWTPSATLNNSNIANPVASPIINTTYYVSVTDANNCRNNDSVKVSIRPPASFNISPDVSTCFNIPVQLTASGGNIYSWSPVNFLNNSIISNPLANPQTTTIFTVNIKETTCNDSTTLTTQVTILPLPTVRASKSNDIDCSNDASQLSASGAAQYSWSPIATLNDPNIINPVATPVTTTQYTVTGKDFSGCINTDTVTVYVTDANRGGYLMPTAFTPNNDGLNDCYGIKYWGVITQLDFSIYNRWGERVFYTNQPGQCWDGTYKGQPQKADVYIYMIKAKTICDKYVFRKGTLMLIR